MSWLSRLATESGFTAIAKSCRDTKILCAQRFVRMFAYGASFLILVHFLSELGMADDRIGLFMTLTLLGDVVISFVLTSITDGIGRRRILAAGCLLMVASGVVFSVSSSYWLLVVASVFGVISPSGNEIGPFKAIEESVLAQLTGKEHRSDVFAWYNMVGMAGAALGTVTCGWTVQALESIDSWDKISAYRVVFVMYAAVGLIKFVLAVILSPAVEVEKKEQGARSSNPEEARLLPNENGGSADIKPSFRQRIGSLVPHITPASRSILYRLLLLFALDSLASGMGSPSWLTYFFTTVHSLQPSSLGTLFLVTNILGTVSNLLALPLARRIGPLKTMIFTHLPSAIFLAVVPLPPATAAGTWVAMAFLALRATTQSMDQAPRQAFLSAAVLPAERTAVLGVVNINKTFAQALGLGLAGVLAGRKQWVALLGGAGALKSAYDLMMLWMFLRIVGREEEEEQQEEDGANADRR